MDELDIKLYLALHGGSTGDEDFYRRRTAGARSLLELGVGDGRILRKLTAPRKVGLDKEPMMIAMAKAAGIDAELHVGAMEDFDLGERFERVLIPASALFAVAGIDAQRRCFERCASHLELGGELWLDCYGSDAFHADNEPEVDDLGRTELEMLDDIEVDGQVVEVYEGNVWFKEEQRFEVGYWFEMRGSMIEQRLSHHYLLAPQLIELGQTAGLELIGMFGDFDESDFRRDSEIMVAGFRRSN
ncbi:MAG: class I SAM-dependent methyltransferase [Myxococcales bacterium]|nr:class I SAM-dependent methyltransferase [Myxococcales bacterium]